MARGQDARASRQNVRRWRYLANRRCLTIQQHITGRKGLLGINRANGQFSAATAQVGLDVRCLGDGGGHRSMLQGPLLFRRVDHSKVVYTKIDLSSGSSAHQVRDGNGRQQSDDRHDYHYLDQCKPPLPIFYGLHSNAFLSQRP